MITIPQGASKKLSVVLKSDVGLIVQDPSLAYNIMLELVHESRKKRLTLYGTNEAYMNSLGVPYQLAYIDGNYIDFYIDGANTADFPPGRILAKFTITYENILFPISGVQTIKGQAGLFNII